MNETMLIVLIAAAVPLAITLLQYALYLLVREHRWSPGDAEAVGRSIAEGLVAGISSEGKTGQK